MVATQNETLYYLLRFFSLSPFPQYCLLGSFPTPKDPACVQDIIWGLTSEKPKLTLFQAHQLLYMLILSSEIPCLHKIHMKKSLISFSIMVC